MFGYVMANAPELPKARRSRYMAVYCGICRGIRENCSHCARLGLSYDMAFLSLLLISLYEPEETTGKRACGLHPLRSWVDNEFVRYGADMNVALGYYNCMDDYEDEGKLSSKLMGKVFSKSLEEIKTRFPRQCKAMEDCLADLAKLEKENCANPDEPAGCFGRLMGELLVYKEDHWSPTLRQLGMALGRYIYLADAAVDYRKDEKKSNYNPFLAANTGFAPGIWEQYLILAMGRCTREFEKLPLVQDKDILDNILYSGVWVEYRRRQRGKTASREEDNDQ